MLLVHRRLQLLIVGRAEAPVAQGVEDMGSMLCSATHALILATVSATARITLHAHQDGVARPYVPTIHLLYVGAVVSGVLG